MKNKKIIIVVLIIVIILSIGLSIFTITKNNSEENDNNIIDGTTVYTSESSELFKDQQVEGLNITNMSLVTTDERSVFKANVTNNSSKSFTFDSEHTLYLTIYSADKEYSTKALSNTTINPGNSVRVEVILENNLTNITKVELLIK